MSNLGPITRGVALACGLCLTISVTGQTPRSADSPLNDGIAALRADRWDAAESQLTSVVTSSPGSQAAATAEFYLGLLWQGRAERATDGDQRRRALEQAAGHYEAAVRGLPRSGPTLNNLARVRGELGDSAVAEAAIDRALALKDGKESAYLRTRADLVASRDASAAEQLTSVDAALRAAPEDAALRERFVQIALSEEPRALTRTTHWLIDNGSVQVAEGLIVMALQASKAPRIELLRLLADALAGQSYNAQTFACTPTAAVLRSLTADAAIGSGAGELLQLHTSAQSQIQAYPWWTSDYSEYEPPDPQSRNASLRRLALALAATARTKGDGDSLRAAQPYAELGIALSGASADPYAILQLADIYANTGQQARLQKISNKYVKTLFQGKGYAYAANDERQIYAFHLALGSIFGYLGQWENPQWQPASAIFQLEHANSTADSINRKSGASVATQVVVPPAAIGLLADAYAATGKPDASAEMRLDSAERYRAQNRPELAKAVLDVPAEKIEPVLARASATTRARWSQTESQMLQEVVPQQLQQPQPLQQVPPQPPQDVPPQAVHELPPNAPLSVVVHPTMGGLRPNVNLQGSDLPGTGTAAATAEVCAAQCLARADCRAMTFVQHRNATSGVCWLKSEVPPASRAIGMTSAIKETP